MALREHRDLPFSLRPLCSMWFFFKIDYLSKMSPAQLSTQCVDNLSFLKNLSTTDHIEYISSKNAPILQGQFSRQCLENPRVIFPDSIATQIIEIQRNPCSI
jgi:hypothetical protein